jgi:hypothetical protein
MIERRSAEEWLAEFEEILRRYRSSGAGRAEGETLTQREAASGLQRLGFTFGEALRLLRPKGAR